MRGNVPGTEAQPGYRHHLLEHWRDRHHAVPTTSNVWYYSNWWPALWVDIGDPNLNGWKHGERDTSYLMGDAGSTYPAGCAPSSKCAPVWRRNFTGYEGTVILDRVFESVTAPSELDRPGPPIPLDDPERKLFGPYYILQADGTGRRGRFVEFRQNPMILDLHLVTSLIINTSWRRTQSGANPSPAKFLLTGNITGYSGWKTHLIEPAEECIILIPGQL
jgi:hypothetical protein